MCLSGSCCPASSPCSPLLVHPPNPKTLIPHTAPPPLSRHDPIDEEFERELSSLLLDAQGRAVPKLQPVPPHPLHAQGEDAGGGADRDRDGAEEAGQASITFKILTKRGGRDDRSKELQVRVGVCLAWSSSSFSNHYSDYFLTGSYWAYAL